MNPKYPLYIPSKGRAESRLTSKALDEMNVPYRLVIEEQEFDIYAKEVDESKLLILDKKFQDEYDTFDDLGNTKSKGPGAARNFIWEHSISEGHKFHWVMDDNIKEFYRLNRNLKVPVSDGTLFKCMEVFVSRFTNVAMAGPNYFMFASRKTKMPPFVLNTRIYSCNFIRNDVPLRWRGRYNEDTDLSIRMMKEGWATVQFNAFLQGKVNTQAVRGGNSEAFYDKEGTKPKSQMQVDMHPDISEVVWKFGRWHHHVDYSGFKHIRLKRDSEVEIKNGVDNFEMKFVKIPNYKEIVQ